MTSTRQASVVRQGFCEAHANACTQRGRHAYQESVPATFRSEGGGKDRRVGLFVAEFFTFSALSKYEAAMKEVVVLAMFTPLCISTGGNSGSQAATLITRALALGHINLRTWWTVVRHEVLMGIALGVTLGIIGFFRVMTPLLTPADVIGDKVSRLSLSLVIGQTVACICLWGTLVGSILPMLSRWLANASPRVRRR